MGNATEARLYAAKENGLRFFIVRYVPGSGRYVLSSMVTGERLGSTGMTYNSSNPHGHVVSLLLDVPIERVRPLFTTLGGGTTFELLPESLIPRDIAANLK